MAYRKRTLRKMSPTARKIARLIGELDSISRRRKTLMPEVRDIEFQAQALTNAKQIIPPTPIKQIDTELFPKEEILPNAF